MPYGNQWGHGRKCRDCGERLRFTRNDGTTKNFVGHVGHVQLVQIASSEAEPILMVSNDGRLLMILDSGCRRSVAGEGWHKYMQKECRKRSLSWKARSVQERFTVVSRACQASFRAGP